MTQLLRRRDLLGAIGFWDGRRAMATLPALRAAAAVSGLLYGAASEVEMMQAPSAYTTLFAAQCAMLAPILPWSAAKSPGDYPFASWEGNVAFARTRGLRLTGSHLLWHEWLPPWFAALNPAAAWRAARAHIAALGKRYAGQVYSWNVVNEALAVSPRRKDGLRDTALLRSLGPDFIAMAFEAAHEADPAALLLYNDYGFEADTSHSRVRRAALLRLVDDLLRRGAPIGGVGLQSHLRLGDPFDPVAYRAFLAEIAARKLLIVLTELDVLDAAAAADLTRRDQAVADAYARFLPVALDEPAVAAVVTWGLSDRHTWLTPTSSPAFARADGLPTRPLPFDSDFQPKPAFQAIFNALRNARPRTILEQ